MKDVVQQIKMQVNIKDIAYKYLQGKGGKFLCPFHEDGKIGSFSINEHEGYFKCFSCNASGDVISLYMKAQNKTFSEAIEELNSLCDDKQVVNVTYKKQKSNKTTKSHEELNKIYSYMSTFGLTTHHKNYLLNRGISEKLITKEGYFSFPDKEFMEGVVEKFQDELIGVPGFYQEDGVVKFKEEDGVVIPLKDTKGLITYLQLRVEGDNRSKYKVYSSSFTDTGVSPVNNAHLIVPDVVEKDYILITEGNFKANVVSDVKKCLAITMQGVNNLNGLLDTVQSTCEKFHKQKIYVAFDADLISNVHVYRASRTLVKELSQLDVEVNYLFWDLREGKGIDDVLLADKTVKFYVIPAKTFATTYNTFILRMVKEEGVRSEKNFREVNIDLLCDKFIDTLEKVLKKS